MRRLSQALFTLLLLFPRLAFADYEFYTYDGFQQITRAFKGIALIFNAPETLALAGTAAMIGIIANGALHIYRTGAGGGGFNPIAAFLPPMLGGALFVSLFVPTDNLHVYDAETNQFETVADVPVGVAILASTINEIERGMVDLINTTFPDTEAAAGAMALMTAQEMFNLSNINPYLYQSLQRYIQDCVVFEMARPGTTLSQETLRTATNSMGELAKAASPAVFTLKYAEGAIYGQAVTCQEAWSTAATGLQAQLGSAATYATHIGAACGRAKFDSSDPQQLAKCTSSLTPLFAVGGPLDMGAAVTAQDLSRQALIAETIEKVATGDTGSSMAYFARREITQKGFGAMIAANEWLPIFKACMMAIIIGLIPLVAVFVASNVGGRALSFLAGSFVFMAAWGVTDAIVTAASAPYIVDMFTSIRDTGLGLETLMNFPDYSTKAASVYGSLRSSAVAFAGMISFALMRFGGHALAQVGGGITGQMQGAGAVAGRQSSPEGVAHAMESMVNAGGTFMTAGEYGYGQRSSARAYGQAHAIESMTAATNLAGQMGQGTGFSEVASAAARANVSLAGSDGSKLSASLGYDGGVGVFNQASQTGAWSNTYSGYGAGGEQSVNSTSGIGSIQGLMNDGQFVSGRNDLSLMGGNYSSKVGNAIAKEGARTLGSNEQFKEQVSSALRSDNTNQDTRDFAEKYQESNRKNLMQSLSEVQGLSKEQVAQLASQISGGASVPAAIGTVFGLKGGAEGLARTSETLTGKDSLSTGIEKAVSKAAEQARTETARQMFSNRDMRSAGMQLARDAGVSEAASMVVKGSEMASAESNFSMDTESAFIKHKAQQMSGNANPDLADIQQAMETIHGTLSSGSAGEQAALEKEYTDFARGYVMNNPISGEAGVRMDAAQERINTDTAKIKSPNNQTVLGLAGAEAKEAGNRLADGKSPEAPKVAAGTGPANADGSPGAPLTRTDFGKKWETMGKQAKTVRENAADVGEIGTVELAAEGVTRMAIPQGENSVTNKMKGPPGRPRHELPNDEQPTWNPNGTEPPPTEAQRQALQEVQGISTTGGNYSGGLLSGANNQMSRSGTPETNSFDRSGGLNDLLFDPAQFPVTKGDDGKLHGP